ncbi:HlyD family secretion protein [Ketobacter sp. MCCC 1A13808]|uniref:HlyD family secretion protein n=1 Tax=Ketobacter sp. MCCC 1A13808 TaxID=2602738 RepID=UPI000F10B27F|nr:HlyD family secretion protein [Ketobacter sp. MCCC 1A13808]MVF10947.1 HlyD family secretion protein [Ketobacter sp. MCCC 1A13808]RLP56338.1 MAG: HlyD family secretion protein [Ketobacter sp.]
MDLLLILTYSALCIVIFKVFKVPLNKWTVPTAILGGIVLIGGLFILMNYNHPYAGKARKYSLSTPIIPTVRGRVLEVNAVPNQMMQAGDILFKLDPIPFQGKVDSLTAQEVAAKADLERAETLVKSGSISQRDRDIARARYDDVQAQLDIANFNLSETVVRAPTSGYVTQVFLRPGMMAVNLPIRPVMVFVHEQEDAFVGWFMQNSLLRLQVGDSAEIAFDGIPGDVFSGEVESIYPLLAEGQLQPNGNLVTESLPPGLVPVRIRITDPAFEPYRDKLPGGAFGQAALYSEHLHHIALIRKVLLRMASWMNYLFPIH